MATAPMGRQVTVRYLKGSVRGARANVQALLGTLETTWGVLRLTGNDGFRRPYGYRRRCNAAAGKPVQIFFSNGDVYTYRVTGTMKAFIDFFLAQTSGNGVDMIVSQRGAEWGKEVALSSPA